MGAESAISTSSVGVPFGIGARTGAATVVGDATGADCGCCSEGSVIVEVQKNAGGRPGREDSVRWRGVLLSAGCEITSSGALWY